MSKYHTQFEESTQTIGTNLAGWTVRGGGSPTYAPAYMSPATLPVKRRYLPFVADSTTDYRCISWDAIDADANRAKANLLTLFLVDLTTAEHIHLYARGAGTGTVTDFYRLRIAMSGANNVAFDKMAASAYTAGVVTATVNFTAGRAYYARFLVDGTTVRARFWDASLGMAGEPSTWSIDTTDSSVTAAGWVALGTRHSTLTAKGAAFNFFAVGTNGDSAVAPRTNTEYAAYLASQNALRCVLAELSATGYDSSGSPYTKTVNWYISNHGYTSHQQDTPSGKHYEAAITRIPTFRREMSSALSGAAQTGFGELGVVNAAGAVQHVENRILYACTFGSWSGTATVSTGAATPPRGRDRADQLTDSSGVAYQNRVQTVTVPNDTGTWYLVIDVLKTSGGTAKTFGVNFSLTGGTAVSRTPRLNTDTGATQNPGSVSAQEVTASDGTAYWRWTLSITNNASGNTTLTFDLYPAVATWPGADSSATTGSAIVSGAWVYRDPQAVYGNTAGTALDSRGVQPGTRDDLLRMRWNRNYLKLYLGDPSWPKHDFRLIVLGRLGMPTAPDEKSIRFPIADLSDFFNKDIQPSNFTSGEYSGQKKPIFLGQIGRSSHVGGQIEPPLTDAANLIYTISDAAVGQWFTSITNYMKVYDNQVLLRAGPFTVSAVDTGTETITASANHGFVDGYIVRFTGGTPPAPLVTDTDYFAVSVTVGGAAFKLALTRGGAAINLTGSTTGATFYGFGYEVSTAGPTTIQLAATPAGRVTVSDIFESPTYGAIAPYYEIAQRVSLSLNQQHPDLLNGLDADIGYWIDTQKHTAAEVLAAIAAGTQSWYGFTPDGLFTGGMIALPTGSATMSFTESDIVKGSMRMADVIRPVDFSKAQIGSAPWFLKGGPFQSGSQAALQGGTFGTGTTPSPTTPLDDYPAGSDANGTFKFTKLYTTAWTGYYDLYKYPLGVFEFETRLPASQLEIGQVIAVTYPRLGWKSYSASDPASPDNTATVDATKAVVIGIDTDIDRGRVRIKCFRRVPGYYPTSDLN